MKLTMPNLNNNLTSRTRDVEPSSVKVDVKPTKNLQEDIARRLANVANKSASTSSAPTNLRIISGRIQTKTFTHAEDQYQVIVTLLRSETNRFNNKTDNIYRIMLEDNGEDYIYEFTSISTFLEIEESAECIMNVCYVPNANYSRNFFTPVTLKKI